MSSSLVKLSLEFVDNANSSQTNIGKKKGRGTKDSLFNLIPKQLATSKPTDKDQQSKTAKFYNVNERKQARRKTPKNTNTSIEDNLRKLRRICGTGQEEQLAQKIFMRAQSKKALSDLKENSTEKEEQSVFTEEDFKKFEEEYFCC